MPDEYRAKWKKPDALSSHVLLGIYIVFVGTIQVCYYQEIA